MPPLNMTEARTVQFPMVRHAVEIEWVSLDPQDATLKRGGRVLFGMTGSWVQKVVGGPGCAC